MNQLSTLITEQVEDESFSVAIHAKTKHPELWAATCRLGSIRKLAETIGMRESTVGEWVNLKSFPSFVRNPEKRSQLSDVLLVVTGKTIDDLWPPAMRKAIGEGKASQETTRQVEVGFYLMSEQARQRLVLESPHDALEKKECANELKSTISEMLKKLSFREREVIKDRFGLEGRKQKTLLETAKNRGTTRERIRQITDKAIRKLQHLALVNIENPSNE